MLTSSLSSLSLVLVLDDCFEPLVPLTFSSLFVVVAFALLFDLSSSSLTLSLTNSVTDNDANKDAIAEQNITNDKGVSPPEPMTLPNKEYTKPPRTGPTINAVLKTIVWC